MKKMFSELSNRVIACAIEVHRHLGPGLLESAYQKSLAYELSHAGIHFQAEQILPLKYKCESLDCGYRIDLLVEECLILELKSVEALKGIHQAQILTYMKLSNISEGLLINFNARLLKEGLKHFVL